MFFRKHVVIVFLICRKNVERWRGLHVRQIFGRHVKWQHLAVPKQRQEADGPFEEEKRDRGENETEKIDKSDWGGKEGGRVIFSYIQW